MVPVPDVFELEADLLGKPPEQLDVVVERIAVGIGLERSAEPGNRLDVSSPEGVAEEREVEGAARLENSSNLRDASRDEIELEVAEDGLGDDHVERGPDLLEREVAHPHQRRGEALECILAE